MESAVPILPADDLAVAKKFYVDGLGFRVTSEVSENGRSGLLSLERGTIHLTLDSPMEGHGRNACVALHVDDTDAYYREWSSKVTVLRSPQDEAWGARTFDLLDPSGNTIFVMGPVRLFSCGLTVERTTIILLSMSNQKGAPSETASAVTSQPSKIFR
jgi:catechol 2,3-dioxygenase-like lactoylglutathione lyase family enzyme